MATLIKKSKNWKYIIALLCLFQSCQFGDPTTHEAPLTKNSLYSGNGSGYDGKLTGEFSRSYPTDECNTPRGSLSIDESSSTFKSVSGDDCKEATSSISKDAIHFSPYNKGVVGYSEGLYIEVNNFNSFIDDNGFSELWCQAKTNEMEGIDIVIEHNILKYQTEATILLGSSVGSGRFEVRKVKDLVLERLRTSDRLFYSYENLFSLDVGSGSFKSNGITFYPGQMQATIDNVKHNLELNCQRGGWLDLEYQRLFIEPTYPKFGALWNGYIGNRKGVADPSMGVLDDISCDSGGLGFGWNGCIHVGDYRKVRISSHNSCNGLTMSDSMGIFNWACRADDDRQGVYFYSQGLRAQTGLSDIVEGGKWRLNQVVLVEDGKSINSSNDTIWWNNPVGDLPDNSADDSIRVALDEPNKIYTFAESRTSKGFSLNAPGIALVGLNASVLIAHQVMAADCAKRGAGLVRQSNTCLINSNGPKGLWVEGNFQGHYGLDTVIHMNSDQVRINQTKVKKSSDRGIFVGGNWTQLTDIEVSQALNHGLRVPPWRYGYSIARLSAFDNGDGEAQDAGVFIGDFVGSYAQRSRLIESKIFNNNGHGIITETEGMELLNVVIAGNQLSGLSLGKFKNKLIGIVAYRNGGEGIQLSGDRNILMNVTSVDNSGNGLNFGGTTDQNKAYSLLLGLNIIGLVNSGEENDISQVASANNQQIGVLASSQINSPFIFGNLQTGTQPVDCALGTYTSNQQYDCANFLQPGTPLLPPIDLNGALITSYVSDASITMPKRNVAGEFLAINELSGDLLRWAPTMDDGKDCPAPLDGNRWKAFNGQVYLPAAVEMIGDQLGNDDGLCESNETCIYTQHYGAYQGRAPLDISCNFKDADGGQLTNIKIFARSAGL